MGEGSGKAPLVLHESCGWAAGLLGHLEAATGSSGLVCSFQGALFCALRDPFPDPHILTPLTFFIAMLARTSGIGGVITLAPWKVKGT